MEIELSNGRKILLDEIEGFKYYDSIYFGTDSCLVISLREGNTVALFSERAIDTLALLKSRLPQHKQPECPQIYAPSHVDSLLLAH
jgi:hypothetical protein